MKLPIKHHGAEITIFSEMTALAQQFGAVDLSQGFPDDDSSYLCCGFEYAQPPCMKIIFMLFCFIF